METFLSSMTASGLDSNNAKLSENVFKSWAKLSVLSILSSCSSTTYQNFHMARNRSLVNIVQYPGVVVSGQEVPLEK